jgi:hypothetical protein
MTIKVVMDKEATLPTELGSKILKHLAAETQYKIYDRNGTKLVVEGYNDLSLLTVAVCRKIVAAGGDVEDFPCFVEFTNPNTQVPLTFPDAVENGVRHTLATYGTTSNGPGLPQNNAPVQIAGKWYKEVVYGHGGKPLKASEWPSDTANIRIIDKSAFLAIQGAG